MKIGQPQSGFSYLSDELVIHVLHGCHFRQILLFAATSKRNHSIVTSSISLQLQIELESSELEIASVGSRERGLTYLQIRDDLFRYHEAWRHLELGGPIERIPKQKPVTWQLREGNYVVAFQSKPGSHLGFDSLQIIPLGSFEALDLVTLDNDFQELAVDVAQDLAVLGKWHRDLQSSWQGATQLDIVIASIRTGLPHPLAQMPTFRIQVDFDYDSFAVNVTLDVMLDILAVEIEDSKEQKFEVMVWNWNSGQFLIRIGSEFGSASLSHFDNTHLGLLQSGPGVDRQGRYLRRVSLSLYRIPSRAYEESPPGNCFCASLYACALPIVTFLFPELDESHQVLSAGYLLDPVPGQILPLDNTTLAHSSAVTFTINLTLQPMKWEDGGPIDYRIFLSARHLRRYLPECASENQTTVVCWDLWGTKATRWFCWNNPNNYDIEWALWTYASRFALVNTNPHSMLHDLSIVDFAPRTARDVPDISLTLHQTSEYKKEMERIVTEGKGLISPYAKDAFQEETFPPVFVDTIENHVPTILNEGFAKPVESCLPYRVVTRPRFLPTCEDWSIDGSHIIGLYVDTLGKNQANITCAPILFSALQHRSVLPMSFPPADVPHVLWGREYPSYCLSYDNESVAVPLLPEKEPRSRVNTLDTINLIYALGSVCASGMTSGEYVTSRITLPMLVDVFEMTKVPQHLGYMAESPFISGCVSLMSSVLPSFFRYEYGYICFRILVIALDACLLKQSNCLDETIERMSVAPTSQRFSIFWDASALLTYQREKEDKHLESVVLAQIFDKSVLDRLLQLLNDDRKMLLLVLKRTSSIALSGLLFTLFRRLVGTDAPYGYDENPDRFKNIILPYSRILWRYLLLPRVSDAEDMVIIHLHNLSSSYARLNDDKAVDVEDARNILQEFNERLGASERISVVYGTTLIRFVAPLVCPGCESLVPTTFKLSIKTLWGSLLSGKEDKEVARYMVSGFLLYLRDIIEALKPRYFTHQPWIWQVVDHVVKEDLVDLALRAMLTAPCFNVKQLDHHESQLLSAAIEFMMALKNLAPHPDFSIRFYDSGILGDWCKYYFYFRVYGTENTALDSDNPKAKDALSPNWACGEIVAGVMEAIMGTRWRDFLCEMAGSCDNPRCPWPVNSRFFCMDCIDLIYCGAECLTADWTHAWGPHRAVCQHQVFQNPDSRNRYHQVVHLPEGIQQGFSPDAKNVLAGAVADYVRTKGSRPKQSNLHGLLIGTNNRVSEFKLDPKVGFSDSVF
ncbi:unnamed protein product [Rhizoctonia solani]|nr:unnamed protein product [Rhizoctonia solani]